MESLSVKLICFIIKMKIIWVKYTTYIKFDPNFHLKSLNFHCNHKVNFAYFLILNKLIKSFLITSLTSYTPSTLYNKYSDKYLRAWSRFKPSKGLTGITECKFNANSSKLVPIITTFSGNLSGNFPSSSSSSFNITLLKFLILRLLYY